MAGFMAGFGTKFSELIEEDRKYYRDRAAKRQEYLQTYGTRAVADREGKANAALGVANYLITNGISKDDVRYVIDTSGVQGLAQLKATIDSRTDLTADEKASLVNKAKDYVAENPDEDLNTVVKRAYGLYKSSDNPVKRERSLFGSILGLDSRMMEDDVMDDLYINGYTGRDIYRIMGSAGPTPGAPLDLDLPSKPPSPTVLNNTAKFLESQFETSIDSRIASTKQKMLNVDPSTTAYSTLADERTKLENMKAKGLLALGQYATEYDSELFNFARAQEEALPGAITRNSYLYEFLPAYNTFFDEAKDEAKVEVTDSTSDALGTPPEPTTTVTPPEAKVTAPTATAHRVETDAEAMELLNSGAVAVGDTIQIADGQPRPVTSLPEDVAEDAKPKTTTTYSTSIKDARDLASVLGDQGVEAYPIISKDDGKGSLIQLGAYDTQQEAEAAYNEIKNKIATAVSPSSFMSYPEDYEPIYEVSESDGRKFVRLRLEVPNRKPTDLGDMTGAPGFREERSSLVSETTSALEKGQATRAFIADAIPDAEDVVSVTANAAAAGIDALMGTSDFVAGLTGLDTFEGVMSGKTLPEKAEAGRNVAQSMRNKAEEIFTMGFSEYMRSVTGKDVPAAVVAEVRENVDTDALITHVFDIEEALSYTREGQSAATSQEDSDALITRAFDTEASQALRGYISLVQHRAYKPASSQEEGDEKPIYTIEEIKAYAENRLGARERQAMEERIRDDARQFLQDEKSFPQPLPTIIIEKLENDIVEEAKVDVEAMRIVQQLDKKGETPSRKDVEDLKTALELNQVVDTSTDELYRGPISGKTLVEKLDDIWNFYTTGEEPEFNPRTVGTVGFQDLGLRHTTDDVRERQNQPADLQMSAARGPSPEADRQDFDSPRNMAVENFTTRGINATPRGLMTPQKEFTPRLGQAQLGDLIDRVHGSSKDAKAFNKKISSDKVTAADVTRLIKATRKQPKTTSRGMLLNSLFDLRDALNKR